MIGYPCPGCGRLYWTDPLGEDRPCPDCRVPLFLDEVATVTPEQWERAARLSPPEPSRPTTTAPTPTVAAGRALGPSAV